MAILNREHIKSQFAPQTKLAAKHFVNLIDSALNKYDDQFHGKWRPGQTYRPGDAVIYEGKLWVLHQDSGSICSSPDQPPGEDSPIWDPLTVAVEDDDWKVVETEEGTYMYAKVYQQVGIGIGEGEAEEPEAQLDVRKVGYGRFMVHPLTSSESESVPTRLSLVHYHDQTEETAYLHTLLELESVVWLTDAAKGFVFRKGMPVVEETELDVAGSEVMMVIRPQEAGSGLAAVGINTEDPTAMLEVTDKQKGQIQLSPEDKKDPAITLVNLDPSCDQNYLSVGVGKRYAASVSDAPEGFVFRKGKEYGEFCAEGDINQGDLLAVIQQHETNQKAQLGIGTPQPEGLLEVQDGAHSQIVLLPQEADRGETTPTGKNELVMSLQRLVSGNVPTYHLIGLAEERAVAVSNAPKGFAFKVDEDYELGHESRADQGAIKLVLRENGHVGIGTENPHTKLEIQGGGGRLLFNLGESLGPKKPNPAISVINSRPESSNYLAVGTDNKRAILVTDSQFGFMFKKGNAFAANPDHAIDLNQGTNLLSILPDGTGKVGVGMIAQGYELDVNGMSRALTYFQQTDESKMDVLANDSALDNVLEKLQALEPVVFKWKNTTGFQDSGKQIGLEAHKVEEQFEEVVRTSTVDQTQAVAYQNLVPVLIKAIQELAGSKDDCQTALDALSDRLDAFESQLNARLNELESRIENCEKS
ncbi:MAG: tail fiber domain-containing protein [Bacteroidota bacterium]